MFLQEADLVKVTKQQYQFKLEAYYGVFTSLLLTQLFALLWSFMGTGQMGTGTQEVSLNITYYTGNIIIMFTMMWAFISGITINSKNAKDGDFAFVSNRLSSNLSNIAFLLTATVLGGFTAMLAGSLLKVIIFYYRGLDHIVGNPLVPPHELALGIIVSVLFVTLIGTLGYFVGALVQFHKIFTGLLPAFFVGLLFLEGRMQGEGPLGNIFQSFINETSLIVLAVKVLIVVVILFGAAVAISDQVEVRK